MSFSDNLNLDGRTGTEAAFNLVSRDGSGTIRIDTASTPSLPTQMLIRHSSSGKGKAAVDRHNLSISRVVEDANGSPYTVVMNITFAVPRVSAVTANDVQDLLAYGVDLLTDGGFSGSGLAGTTALTQFIRGES